jgi:hypothetical protein
VGADVARDARIEAHRQPQATGEASSFL